MAKIIKHGAYYGKSVVTCPECGCVFYPDASDYSYVEKSLSGARVVICPKCGYKFNMKDYPKDHDWYHSEDTFRIHPESDPKYTYNIHNDKYELPFNSGWDYPNGEGGYSNNPEFSLWSGLPNDYTDYIAKVNSIDNYKLPDDITPNTGSSWTYTVDKDNK